MEIWSTLSTREVFHVVAVCIVIVIVAGGVGIAHDVWYDSFEK